jgi:hypothetical protein
MVASYRCNELKEEAVALIQDQLAKLETNCQKTLIPTFKTDCQAIAETSIKHYTDVAV